MRATYLLCGCFIALMLLSNLCTPAESLRVLFYNKEPTVRTSQLLLARKIDRPCPKGKMRDHRNRCRRAIIFSRKTSN